MPRPFSSPRRRTARDLFLLALAPSLFFWPMLSGRLPDYMDSAAYLYPLRMAAARQMAEGVLPLWLPNQMAGVPLAANPQLAIWLPTQAPFWLWPGPAAFGLVSLLHLFIAGAGMYFLTLRVAGRHHRGAALFAGLLFEFTPMMVARTVMPVHLLAFAWLPWLFWAADGAAREPGWSPGRGTLAAAGFGAMLALSGAPQVAYLEALAVGVFWLAQAGRAWPRALAKGVMAAGLAGALAGIQLIPTLELLSETDRAPFSAEVLAGQALNGQQVWRTFLGFTQPEGEDLEGLGAIGLGATLLVGLALARKKSRRRAAPFLIAGLLGWLLAMGLLVPIWTKALPLYDRFRAPRRSMILWEAGGMAVAGIGAAALAVRLRRRRAPRWVYPTALAGLGVGTVWLVPRAILPIAWSDPARFDPPAGIRELLGEDRYITLDPTFRYVHGCQRPDYGPSLLPNLAALNGLHDLQGYDPLILSRRALARNMGASGSILLYPSHATLFPNPDSPVLRLFNVQHVIGRLDLFEPKNLMAGAPEFDDAAFAQQVETVRDVERWPIHRFRERRPRAWTVGRVYPAADAAQALREAVGLMANPYREAFSEDGFALTSFAEPPPVERVENLDARSLRVVLAQPAREPAMLCLSVGWMPGWRARTPDGENLAVMPMDGVIIGAALPEEASEVVFRYEPNSFLRGALLTFAGAMLWLALWLRAGRLLDAYQTSIGGQNDAIKQAHPQAIES
jgi:hypothetical protein